MSTATTPVIGHSPLLTGIATRIPMNKWAGLELAPPTVRPGKQGTYTVYGLEHLRKDGDYRSVGASAKEAVSSRSTSTYECVWHSIRHAVYWDDVDQAAGDGMDVLKENAVNIVRSRMLNEREGEIATLASTLSSYTSGSTTNYHTVTNKWDTSTTDVMEDIATACEAIVAGTGAMPNKIFIPAAVAVSMAAQNPFANWIDYRLTDTNMGQYGIPMRLPMFGLDVVILNTHYISDAAGGSNNTLASLWSDNVIVAYVNPNWYNRDFTFMTTFTSQLGPARSNSDLTMWEYDDDEVRATYVEGLEWRQAKVITNLAGYLIRDTLT